MPTALEDILSFLDHKSQEEVQFSPFKGAQFTSVASLNRVSRISYFHSLFLVNYQKIGNVSE